MLAESKKQLGQVSLFLNIDMHMHMHVHHLITCFVGVEYQVNIDPEFSI
jgi:hypothetical protein